MARTHRAYVHYYCRAGPQCTHASTIHAEIAKVPPPSHSFAYRSKIVNVKENLNYRPDVNDYSINTQSLLCRLQFGSRWDGCHKSSAATPADLCCEQ
eukprot:4791688-Amphidinium_carterae.1